eukprot:31439-Pelagococcus_subviridis.AAC.17
MMAVAAAATRAARSERRASSTAASTREEAAAGRDRDRFRLSAVPSANPPTNDGDGERRRAPPAHDLDARSPRGEEDSPHAA